MFLLLAAIFLVPIFLANKVINGMMTFLFPIALSTDVMFVNWAVVDFTAEHLTELRWVCDIP